ncbi:glucosamine-6-phosphate deaminase [Oceanobacillus halophilus]|uniref:Glucosamine-6-phosphate deaminase n=1 Tax=Oceanobacillus halophilus TaxID=930130 RepID=A0A495A346_9BACI|nr:glucosamine-6-phosphate deaminase [Oceanobacillus halophilus]RKQ32517.1 glucosamine-6-phosphate deaminase [Oceanobacillus halophilus]
MNIIKVKDYQEMSNRASMHLAEKIQKLDKPVIGLATGSTPEGMYQNLIEKNNKGELSFKDVTTFNLDEYVGLEKEDPNSYYFYMMDKFFNHIDVPKANVHLPNGAADDLEKECRDYEKLISDAGYVDVQVLGIGGNGHIAFNEPGTPFSSRTHVIDLDESTREANARFFNSMEEVPKQAITMGIETIMESKEIILLISGEKKADALARLIENEETSEDFPASVLRKHENVTIIADEAAMAKVNK